MLYQFMGKRIRQQRQLKHMTQEYLAEQAGISLSFLGHIERGTRKASLDTVVKICNALKVSPNMLLQDSLESDLLSDGMGLTETHRRLLREISDNIMKYSVEIPEDL
jgi:transcriptional regulator with XRE-family HTH domain